MSKSDSKPAIILYAMSLLRSVSTVSSMTLLSRLSGLVRELVIASSFGASAMTDAFNVAFRIPNLLRRLFAEGAFSQVFVPMLASSHAQGDEERTRALVNNTATALAWTLLVVSTVGVLAASFLVWLLASGFASEAQAAATVMTRIMFPYIVLISLVAFASAVLNTWQHFAIAAFTPVLLNLLMIAAAVIATQEDVQRWLSGHDIQTIYVLAVGVMAGGVLQLLVQWRALVRLGLQPKIYWRSKDLVAACCNPSTKKLLQLMMPILVGVGAAQLSLIINTQIASYQGVGSVSWLAYADRLMEFPTAMLGVALGVVLTPALARAKAATAVNVHAYSEMLDWGLRLVVIGTLPCAVALGVFAQPLVAGLFHYGAFGAVDVYSTSAALRCYGVGLLGLVAIKVLAAGFYAQQNTRTPLYSALIALGATQVLNFGTVVWLQHAGLALSIGLGALINALLLLRGLLRSGVYIPCAGWAGMLLRVCVANLLLGVLLSYASQAFPWLEWQTRPLWRIGALLGMVLMGSCVYLLVLHLLGLRMRQYLRPPILPLSQGRSEHNKAHA